MNAQCLKKKVTHWGYKLGVCMNVGDHCALWGKVAWKQHGCVTCCEGRCVGYCESSQGNPQAERGQVRRLGVSGKGVCKRTRSVRLGKKKGWQWHW